MKGLIASTIAASLLASTVSSAFAEPKFIFRMTKGGHLGSPTDKGNEVPDDKETETPGDENEAPDDETIPEDIAFRFAPSTYCVDSNMSMTGLADEGHLVALESGALPRGMSVSGTSISGTPRDVGTFNDIHFKVTTPRGGSKVFGPYSMTVASYPMLDADDQQIFNGSEFNYTIPVIGGTAPYKFMEISGFPSGLSLSETGGLHGDAYVEDEYDWEEEDFDKWDPETGMPPIIKAGNPGIMFGEKPIGETDLVISITDANNCSSTGRVTILRRQTYGTIME